MLAELACYGIFADAGTASRLPRFVMHGDANGL
jgi:hypothetical protein